MGLYRGSYRGYQGDARSLDYSSHVAPNFSCKRTQCCLLKGVKVCRFVLVGSRNSGMKKKLCATGTEMTRVMVAICINAFLC